MRDIGKKILTVALAAVFAFTVCVPVPVGVNVIDRARYEEAEAVPVAIVPIAIFGTALAAYGVYAAGQTVSEYNTNLETLYEGVAETAGMTTDEMDTLLTSSVTGAGTIALAALGNAFFNAVYDYAASQLSAGTAVSGDTSLSSMLSMYKLGGYRFQVVSPDLSLFNSHVAQRRAERVPDEYSVPVGMSVETRSNGYGVVTVRYANTTTVSVKNQGNNLRINGTYHTLTDTYNISTGESTSVSWGSTGYPGYFDIRNYDNPYTVTGSVTRYYLFNGVEYAPSSGTVTNESVSSGAVAVVSSGVAAGTASYPTTTVEVFEPTAEQLSAGYDNTAVIEAQVIEQGELIADLTERINVQAETISDLDARVGTLDSRVGTLEADVSATNTGIDGVNTRLDDVLDTLAPLVAPATGILALLNPLAGIAGNVATIVADWAGIQEGPFAWLAGWWSDVTGWWNTLITWLGTGTFAGTMAEIIANLDLLPGALENLSSDVVGGIEAAASQVGGGVSALPRVVEQTGADVAGQINDALERVKEGVLSIPGAVTGAAEGVLDGVLSIPGAISTAAESVLAGVLSIPDALAGALEGVQIGGGGGVAVGVGSGVLTLKETAKSELDAKLEERVPWCYMIRAQRVGDHVASAFSSNASFYVDMPMPMQDPIRFDAGMVLNQEYGGLTVAQYMRVLLTSLLCAGMLALAIRVAMRTMGGAE